jgi:transcriptional regulator with XRE-family HTH domain
VFDITDNLMFVNTATKKLFTMTLDEWMVANGISRAETARRLGLGRSVITDACKGRFWPSLPTMLKIVAMTNGEVTPNDFLPPGALKRRRKDEVKNERRGHEARGRRQARRPTT